MTPYLAAEDLSMFGRDPWWLVVIKAVFCFAFLMVTVLFSIVWERKVVAWMQLRIGPNRHGPWGMLQSLADGIKLMLKEDVIVKRADKVVYVLAPIVAAIPAFMAIAVIPFGPAGNEISIFGQEKTAETVRQGCVRSLTRGARRAPARSRRRRTGGGPRAPRRCR